MFTSTYNTTATYWTPGEYDGYGGRVFGTPVSVRVRWEDKVELVKDNKGEEFNARANVFVEIDVEVGGYLFHGVSPAADPTTVEGAFEIGAFEKIPSLNALEFVRKAFIKW